MDNYYNQTKSDKWYPMAKFKFNAVEPITLQTFIELDVFQIFG